MLMHNFPLIVKSHFIYFLINVKSLPLPATALILIYKQRGVFFPFKAHQKANDASVSKTDNFITYMRGQSKLVLCLNRNIILLWDRCRFCSSVPMPVNINFCRIKSQMAPDKIVCNLPEFFWYFYKPYKKIGIPCFIFCASLIGLQGLINSYITKSIINSLSNPQNAFHIQTILWPSILMVLNLEIHNICWRAINYINLKIAPEIKNKIIQYVFDYVHSQPQYFFQDNLSGSISNNISMLTDSIEKAASVISLRVIRGLVQLSVALVGTYFVHPVFSIALLIWTIGFTSISMLISKKIGRFSRDCAQSQSQISGKIVDSIANFSNVKLFSRKDYESLYLASSLNSMKQKFRDKEWFLIKIYFFQGFSITCLMAFMIYSLAQLKTSNQVTVGDFAFILGISFYVMENVWSFTEQFDQINDIIGKGNQSLKMLFSSIDLKDGFNVKPLLVEEGGIVFENVQFHYKGAEPLFQDKSLVIMPKQKVGLVGYSGSGKSTFVNLILRLYNVTSGRILIDGQDIQNVTQDSLSDAICIIPQDPSLFHRSVMENIRYGDLNATDYEIIKAAKQANAHEFIMNLPKGYDSLVGEHGVKLSGGQRQRIAIARAILKKSPILILDEATSQIDSVMEKVIKQSLHDLMINRTTIVIAHRLSTLLHMDRILVLENGKIIEDGTHTDLLAKKGLYNALWDTQIKGFDSLKWEEPSCFQTLEKYPDSL